MTKEEKKELITSLGIVILIILTCFMTIFVILTKGYILLVGPAMMFIMLILVIVENKDVIYFPWRREKYKTKKEP